MSSVNVTVLRNHLSDYLKKVQFGEEIAILSRGKIVARLVPVLDESEAARRRLATIRGASRVGDVISPIEDWEGAFTWEGDLDRVRKPRL